MKSIDKVEYYEQEQLIQVFMKDEVEQAIMRQNTGQFKLGHSLPLLEGELCEELSISGEDKLLEDLL